jgi:hypothetical protein
MKQAIKVLLIDDDENNYLNLKNDAAEKNIELLYCNNSRGAIQMLKNNGSIIGIIIDGVGFIESDQQRGSEKPDFVHVTLEEIHRLEKEENTHFAKCVYTAYYENLIDSLQSRIKVFDKKRNVEIERGLMFDYIFKEAEHIDVYKIKTKYADVFKYINSSYFRNNVALKKFFLGKNPVDKLEKMYMSLFKKIENNEFDKYALNNCRDILEFYLIALSATKLPSNLFYQDGRPNQSNCLHYILGYEIKDKNGNILHESNKGEKYFNPPIKDCFRFLKNITNEKSHLEKYKCTKYLFLSIVYLLIEVLIWIVDENI